MKEITVKQTTGRALRFKGEFLAEVATSPNNASGRYSGAVGRWTEYRLWKTSGGNFVGLLVHRTQWQGENDHAEARIMKSPDEVFAFFGDDSLAQELYDEAELEYVTEVA